MAYITATDVKAIRIELKEKFPAFKFSVRKSAGNLAVDVTVLSGPCEFSDCLTGGRCYAQINQYHTENMYPTSYKLLDEMIEVMTNAPGRAGGRVFYDNTDTQIDYFDTAFYMNLGVGGWDKPYIVV
jgi:hypothetical protein